ncbi:Serpentine receptor class gamma [Meloidogyne graminicola]|uniref:Serpentine receptor class gamma n=1 Tax=Meloidogyne graminicola TaxID=189291 RepID=A0A8S9ZK58_9BILA|nr:Serpentine receptor class gamma [Meloidogyne graminicola]
MNTTWIYSLFNTLSQSVIIPNIISWLIVIPSSILYITELVVIFSSKESCYKSSFFKLFVSIIGLIGHILYLRIGRLGLFLPLYLRLPPILFSIFYFIAVHFFYVEGMATAMLLLNRLSALVWPLKYEIIWKKLKYWPIIFVFIFPLFLSSHVLFLVIIVWVHNDNNTFTLYTKINPWKIIIYTNDINDLLITTVFCLFFTIFCLFINIACLFVYKKTKIVNSQAMNSKQKMETKLTIYSILTFIGQLLYSIYIIILYISVFQLQNFGIDIDFIELIFLTVFNQFAWVNDLCTIAVPSFLLLWASEKMNTHIYLIIQKIICLPKIIYYLQHNNKTNVFKTIYI